MASGAAAGTARPAADPERARHKRAAKLSDLSDFFLTSPLLGDGPGAAAERSRRRLCLFERAAPSWWEPRFDSDILEGQYRETTFLRIKRRLQIGLVFALLAGLIWCGYVVAFGDLGLLVVLLVLCMIPLLATLAVSETTYLERHLVSVSAVTACALCLLSLLPAAARLAIIAGGNSVTELQLFTWAVITITLVYTMIPMPLYVCFFTMLVYSILFETLSACDEQGSDALHLCVRAALHVCLHLLGLRTLVLAQVHMRSTFTTVGQTLLTRRQLEQEKQLKEKMIHSVMPVALADWAQDTMHDEHTLLESTSLGAELAMPQASTPVGHEISFRPFNMKPMDPVSILFADIVGFTRMSSNKTAEQLVGLLNDLFGRFDELCARLGCEKISTLGDCYYCVSGCPEPRADHAHCCVEMGLAMITAIQQFDVDKGEDVNMRVGVHTGRVLCGLVGTQRFKFDVWSNDVNMANKMESSGRPGSVHISEKTYKYLHQQYLVTPGEPLSGLKTFFIAGRRDVQTPKSEPSSPPGHGVMPSFDTLFQKASSLPSIIETPDTPRQVEPVSQSLTLDRRASRRPRLRNIRTEADLKARLGCGPVRTRLAGGVVSLQPLPEEHPPPTASRPLFNLASAEPEPDEDDVVGASMSSFNSRKDSGIRSRRSSIQAEIAVLNGMKPADLLTHRVSGYYTSSQSSLLEPPRSPTSAEAPPLSAEELELLSQDPAQQLSQQLMQRKLSDLQMIKCVQQMSSHSNYFINPPIDRVTLFYQNSDFERLYRHQHARRHHGATNALSLPKYNILVDTIVACVVFLVIAAALYATLVPRTSWIVFSCAAAAWLVLMQSMMWFRLASGVSRDQHHEPTRFALIYTWYTRWYPFHVAGATLIAPPAVAVLINWTCDNFDGDCLNGELFYLMFFVCLIHYCNFTQLNCWMKSSLATLSAAAMTALLYGYRCGCPEAAEASASVLSAGDQQRRLVFPGDVVVAMVVLVVLVWILNREFEVSYRLDFCVNLMAARDKAEVQRLKNQADWLLHQIIPPHVADVIKAKAEYSENHHNVAVVFASIINFNDLYDETYHGGKEYLRVLNEIIGDMDDLLKKYPSVEKIKTIGSTYMAASGLDSRQRREAERDDTHLVQLMQFAMDLQKTVEAFNVSLFSFEMELRVGYNFGDVTAGVIGTTKLYYDIWGDTVNTASRMDSTGVPGRIQTTERCANVLEPYFEFERRGEVFVKGKDNMVTYFVKGARCGSNS